MIKLSHTQGPWIYREMQRGIRITSPFQKAQYSNCDIPVIAKIPFHRQTLKLKHWEDDKEAIANGILISAAPDMLEALIIAYKALEYISDYDIPLCTHKKIKDAIEQATGMTIDKIMENEI